MKNLLRLEEVFLFGPSMRLFSSLDRSGWLYAGFFPAPDLGMLGQLRGPRFGSWTYHPIHHKGLAVVFYVIALLAMNPVLQFAGLILPGRSSPDRALGHGLKYPDAFQNTHLGIIGKSS